LLLLLLLLVVVHSLRDLKDAKKRCGREKATFKLKVIQRRRRRRRRRRHRLNFGGTPNG